MFRSSLFIAGVLVRVALLVIVRPQAPLDWYVPFMDVSARVFTLDPWHAFLAQGGTPLAFPYGYVTWLTFLPLSSLAAAAGASVWWGYGLTLLLVDVAMLRILKALIPISDRLLLATYWWSPIVLFATYWLGLHDLVPVVLLCAALLCARRLRLGAAGLLCGAAVSAKLSMVLAVPLFVIYLFRNRGLRRHLTPYLAGLSGAFVVFGVPFLLSSDALRMLVSNPEVGKVFDLAIESGAAGRIYVLPMAYLLTTYLLWRVRRVSFDLFVVLLGISFFLVLLLTPASPGWFLWVIPLLIYYQAVGGRVAVVLVAGFTVLYVVTSFITMPQPAVLGTARASDVAAAAGRVLATQGFGLLHTVLVSFGVVLIIRIWQETVHKNDFFRLSRRPLVVGIAGDSGSGKDTLADSIVGLFGAHSTVRVSGDDYHLWDRRKPMWQVMTHLNPRANDLERFTRDLLTLVDGKATQTRHYDHATGTMSRPRDVRTNDFIIASGLHALHLPALRESYDVSIYLEMDEQLRRYFKIRRDTGERGRGADAVRLSLDQREADSAQFIRPQAAHADLVLCVQPLHPLRISDDTEARDIRLQLVVRSRNAGYEASLARVLVGLCGLHVDVTHAADSSEARFTIEGEASSDDISFAARELVPAMAEVLDSHPRWESGVKGLMQLIVVSHINHTLRTRLV